MSILVLSHDYAIETKGCARFVGQAFALVWFAVAWLMGTVRVVLMEI
jgi:hypothetical protein